MLIRQYLALVLLRATARAVWRLIRVSAAAAVIIAAAPVSAVAAAAAVTAWMCGWPPRRLYGAALWCLPMLAVWLTASGLSAPGPPGWRVAGAPYRAWLDMWRLAAAGHLAAAAVVIAPAAIPLGLLTGGLAWAVRIYQMETGAGGLSPGSAVSFDRRQWRRQARSARARIAAPGAVPLTHRNGDVVIGGMIRAIRHPARAITALPYARLRSHQVVIGTTGTGKTTLLLRLWAGFMATALSRQAAGTGRRPLLVVLDCKGGADSRRIADRARRVLRDAGARATAIWPDDASLSLWNLPPGRLITTLLDLIEHGRGAAAYYADVMEAIVALAVQAPPAPPADAADFLARLDADWLMAAYASGDGADRATGCAARSPRCVRRSADPRRGAAVPQPVAPPGHRLRARGQLRRRGRLVLHPGGNGGDGGGRGPGPGAGGHAGQLHQRPRGGRGRAAGRRRVQRGLPAAADLGAVRAGPVARAGRAGLRAVLAGTGRRRGRAVPDRGDRRGRHLAAAHAAPRSRGRAGRVEAICRQHAAADRRSAEAGHGGTAAPVESHSGARRAVPGCGRCRWSTRTWCARSGWARPPTCIRAG